jgi:hypothetical protein
MGEVPAYHGLSRRRARGRVPSLPSFNTAFPAVLSRRPRKNGANASFGRTATMRPSSSQTRSKIRRRSSRLASASSSTRQNTAKSSSTRPASSMFGLGSGASAASSSCSVARRARYSGLVRSPSSYRSRRRRRRSSSAVARVLSTPLFQRFCLGARGRTVRMLLSGARRRCGRRRARRVQRSGGGVRARRRGLLRCARRPRSRRVRQFALNHSAFTRTSSTCCWIQPTKRLGCIQTPEKLLHEMRWHSLRVRLSATRKQQTSSS